MIDTHLAHQILRWLHIVVGFAGLAVFWIPVFARKGSVLHIRCGKVFVACAHIVAISALISSAWALLFPASFIGPSWELASESARTRVLANLRFFFPILFYLAWSVLLSVRLGMHVMRTKQAPEKTASVQMHLLQGVATILSLALAWGIVSLAREKGYHYAIWVALGVLGLLDAWGTYAFFAYPRPTPRAWWYKHTECMLGAGIGFHTAFLVFGFSRILRLNLSGPAVLIPWLLPSLIGVPIIVLWIRIYKKRFGELNGREMVDTHQNEATYSVTEN